MRIAVDAMGGDRGPDEILAGVRLFLSEETDAEILLVGQKERLEEPCRDMRVKIIDARSVVGMHESPSIALKTKRDSSIAICTSLVKEGQADALLTMGNSGAAAAFALFVFGRIANIAKPALVAALPSMEGNTLLMDLGATVDCKPSHLLNFAVMGSCYKRLAFNVPNPRVGLLSIGEEKSKGNELTLGAAELLERAPIHFIGNVEGGDIIRGTADVVVCDGFVGNVILKFGEALAEMFVRAMKLEIDHVLGAEVDKEHRKTFLKELLARVDYDTYGGALLLGVNGHCLIGHGRAGAKAVASGIRAANNAASKCPVDAIRQAIESVGSVAA